MRKSFYILPIHNKESMLSSVLNGIVDSHNSENLTNTLNLICILDGCIDSSESILKKFAFDVQTHSLGNVDILYKDDVHEIECLNTALQHIKEKYSPDLLDMIFMVQDDVILNEPDINKKFEKLFNSRDDLGYISMRLGVSLYVESGEIKETNYIESEFGHWNQLNWNFHKTLKHGEFVESEISIRSPTCTEWRRFIECGDFDFNLAPCGYDCHDFSIRMNKAGYKNGIYAMKFKSDVNWGTMRSDNPSTHNDKVGDIYTRNRKYVANKHKDYFGV